MTASSHPQVAWPDSPGALARYEYYNQVKSYAERLRREALWRGLTPSFSGRAALPPDDGAA